MIKATLQLRDGIGNRIWLRSVVKTIQQGLRNAGQSITVDGRFGSGTKAASENFQHNFGIQATGIIHKTTWIALDDLLPAPDQETITLLPKFFGDLEWVHQQEGHRGRPYWPGGNSGVTLDPGIDLGHANSSFIELLYAPLVSKKQLKHLQLVFGFKGSDARDALKSSPVIQSIRITSPQAVALMPHTAAPYWAGIKRRFPALGLKSTPASVQTVLLSLAYNRGILNRFLDSLSNPIKQKHWSQVATLVGKMQQSHKLKGIRLRRRQEKLVIQSELAFLAND